MRQRVAQPTKEIVHVPRCRKRLEDVFDDRNSLFSHVPWCTKRRWEEWLRGANQLNSSRQTNKQTNKQTDRQTNKQTQTHKQTNKHPNPWGLGTPESSALRDPHPLSAASGRSAGRGLGQTFPTGPPIVGVEGRLTGVVRLCAYGVMMVSEA